MAVQHHGAAVHPALWVSFDKPLQARVQWTGGAIAEHRRSPSIDPVRAFQPAVHHPSATAGGIAEADRPRRHRLIQRMKGSCPVPDGSLCVFSAAEGGRTIWIVTEPSSPPYTTALTPPSW